ncbi:MAG TPA: deoxynucleoside kinase [Candidatus Nanoarchaeia archaeon]|nr:deoxynucleoside kinase [Candidatus Nanoarchaeia archaeon]
MIIYVCGPHGVGKTTLVKSVNVSATKVFDTDISDELTNGINARNQFIRHELFFKKVSAALKEDKNIIVDQCPEAFSFYDKAHHVKGFISDNDFFMLKADFKKRLDDFNKLIKDEKQVYVYLKGDSDLLFSNIKSRNRTSLLHESDVNYLNLIVNEFESVIKSKAVVIELKDSNDYGLAVRKVEGLVNENSNF